MVVMDFEIDKGSIQRIDAAAGDRLHVRLGDVWVTQHADSKDYMLRTGESMLLSGGVTLAMAYKRTQLAWYRSAPRRATRARPLETLAWLRKIFA
jgi:hypothetical protein